MIKIPNFLTVSCTFPEIFLVSTSGFSIIREKSFHFQCESWSGVSKSHCESPASSTESSISIKIVKIATFLTVSWTFPEIFLVWKSVFSKLRGKSFHFQCESWSGTTVALHQSHRRAGRSGLSTPPWRVLKFSRIDQPSTFELFDVPDKLRESIRIFL